VGCVTPGLVLDWRAIRGDMGAVGPHLRTVALVCASAACSSSPQAASDAALAVDARAAADAPISFDAKLCADAHTSADARPLPDARSPPDAAPATANADNFKAIGINT